MGDLLLTLQLRSQIVSIACNWGFGMLDHRRSNLFPAIRILVQFGRGGGCKANDVVNPVRVTPQEELVGI